MTEMHAAPFACSRCDHTCPCDCHTQENALIVAKMTASELDDIITGKTRLGETHEEQLTAWNLAIDEEEGRR